MATLAEIKAHLAAEEAARAKAEEQRKTRTAKGGGDKALFPFFEMNPGQQTIFRFLADGNPDNILPWVQRQTIEIPFDGTVGGEVDTTGFVKIKVPCPYMFSLIDPEYKIACKITAHIRPWWKEPKDSVLYKQAQTYYRKQSWLMQGFAVEKPFEETDLPENPIRRITLTKKLFEKVNKAYNGTEFEEAVHDFDAGTDFVIMMEKQGEFNNYDSSYFQRRSRSLTAEERAAVDQYGLFVLKDFVGKAPTQEQVDAQYEMFLDSLAGKPYDFAKFGKFYRPWGVKGPKEDENSSQSDRGDTPANEPQNTAQAPSQSSSDESAVPASTGDLIARIRRNAMQKSD